MLGAQIGHSASRMKLLFDENLIALVVCCLVTTANSSLTI